ncbi:MAG: hypothetical protein AB7O67_08730 [Vicinamibacterales bacterium]
MSNSAASSAPAEPAPLSRPLTPRAAARRAPRPRRSLGDRAPSSSPAPPAAQARLEPPTPPSCTSENHHLWKNGRFWWVAFTVLQDGYRQHRVRESLRTDDVELARRRRDRRMAHYDALPGHEVTCLARLRAEQVPERARAS